MNPLIRVFAFFIISDNPLYSQSQCDVCEKLKNNVVQITATFDNGGEENGFGTVIAERDNKLYIVTAKHVIYNLDNRGFISTDSKTKSVTLKFFSDQGKDCSANLLSLSNTTLDISLLEVEKPKNYIWAKNFYSKAIQKGTKVWFIGRAGKWYIPTGSFVGSINDISPDNEILIDINSIQPGTSGAPLISPDGVVGLIFEDAASGAKAYSIDKIIKVITNTWNYPWQMTLNTNVTQPDITEREDKAWVEITNEKKEKNKIDKLGDYVSKGQGIHIEDAKKMYEGLLWANIDRLKYMQKYVQHFPEGQYIKQVEDKAYQRYRSINPEFYVDLFPQGKYIDEAEESIWQDALITESKMVAFKAMGYEEYLKYFPKGKHSDAARQKVKQYKNKD